MAYIGQKPGSNFRNVTLKDSFTGDGSTTAFDLSKSFNQAGQNDLEVFVDNVRQEPTAAYTVGQDDSGNFKRVTFTAAPTNGATIYILNQGETSGVLSVSDGAITSGKLGTDVITGQTELAEAANNADTVLLHDDSAGSLKKIQVSNLTAQAGDGLAKSSSTLSVDANNATTLETAIAAGDFVLIYDASAGVLRKVSQTNFLNFPTISSVSPTNLLSGDGTGNYTIVITGTGFSGASAKLINTSGTEVEFDTVTVDSSTQITGVIAKSSLPNSGEPYDIKVLASSGLNSIETDVITIDAQPVWSTASGSLATVTDETRSGLSYTVAAADPESGGDVTYTLESGSLPAGLSGSSTSSGYVISGNATAVGADTTSNFTIRASDVNSNTSDRAFSITIQAPKVQVFTSSGTFSVPSGVTSVDVLVVAGGGGGGQRHSGGGGAGGLIFRPGFPVTPGGTVSVTVGCGGAVTGQGGNSGGGSVFGTLNAQGGGGGGSDGGTAPRITTNNQWTKPGGSGGGGSHTCTGAGPLSSGAGNGTQPTCYPGQDSSNYGHGNPGGRGSAFVGAPQTSSGGGGAGGGGAGAAGSNVNPAGQGSAGGIGRSYTIADNSTPVYYAGGGGGGGRDSSNGGPSSQGGGGAGGPAGPSSGQPGTANRGGGGGGGTGEGGQPQQGGVGGKGVVIVRWS